MKTMLIYQCINLAKLNIFRTNSTILTKYEHGRADEKELPLPATGEHLKLCTMSNA